MANENNKQMQTNLDKILLDTFNGPLKLLNEFYPINSLVKIYFNGWTVDGQQKGLVDSIEVDGIKIKVDVKGNKIVKKNKPNNRVLR